MWSKVWSNGRFGLGLSLGWPLATASRFGLEASLLLGSLHEPDHAGQYHKEQVNAQPIHPFSEVIDALLETYIGEYIVNVNKWVASIFWIRAETG